MKFVLVRGDTPPPSSRAGPSSPGANKLRPKANSPSDHFIFKRSEVLLGQRLRSARYVLSALRDQGNPSMLPFARGVGSRRRWLQPC